MTQAIKTTLVPGTGQTLHFHDDMRHCEASLEVYLTDAYSIDAPSWIPNGVIMYDMRYQMAPIALATLRD